MARRTKPTLDNALIEQLLEGREHSAALAISIRQVRHPGR